MVGNRNWEGGGDFFEIHEDGRLDFRGWVLYAMGAHIRGCLLLLIHDSAVAIVCESFRSLLWFRNLKYIETCYHKYYIAAREHA